MPSVTVIDADRLYLDAAQALQHPGVGAAQRHDRTGHGDGAEILGEREPARRELGDRGVEVLDRETPSG
jgi:hypothetical protein